MPEEIKITERYLAALQSILDAPDFSASEFMDNVRMVFHRVSRRIESAAEGRAVLESLLSCKTRAQAMQLLNPNVAPDPGVKAAWKIRYTGCEEVLNSVAAALRRYAGEWNPEKKYAPLTSIIQSSGWGKSRLVHELWRKDVFVFYISCMGEDKTGFPFRTPHLGDVLHSGSESEVIALLASIMSVLGSSTKSCLEWIRWQQEEDGGCYNTVWKEYRRLKETFAAPKYEAGSSSLEHYRACLGVYNGVLAPLLEKLEDKFLLLCVDEAMDLGEMQYTLVRRALKYVPGGGRFFTVVLGTDISVWNSSLAKTHLDGPSPPTKRVRLAFESEVYPPICLVSCSDVLVPRGETSPDTSPDKVLQYGRPLWAGYMRCLDPSANKRDAAVELAKTKLLGGRVSLQGSSWLTRDVAVAVLGTLIGLDVVAWGTLPQRAVARHMRTIVNVRTSGDRSRVYTEATAEPALAVAAAELLHLDVVGFVKRLTELCGDGLVVEGLGGEMVARLVILLAMHQCTKPLGFIAPVRLRDFLVQLYGADIVEQLHGVDMDQLLFFNYFVATKSEPCDQRSIECYRRNAAAWISRRDESCVDLQLPTLQSTPASPRVVHGCVSFEIQNQRDASGTHLFNGAGENGVKPSLRIVQNIGRDEEKARVEQGVVIVDGLGCKFLTGQLWFALKILSKACENELKSMSEEERAMLKGLLPLQY